MPVSDAGDRLERELRREVLQAGDSAEEKGEVVEPERRRLAGDPSDDPDGRALEPVRFFPGNEQEDAKRVSEVDRPGSTAAACAPGRSSSVEFGDPRLR